MKRIVLCLISLVSIFSLFGCCNNDGIKRTVKGDYASYYEMDDGTWELNGFSYKYRLEITGRLHSAEKDTTYIYLSNIPEISFDRACRASGLSSNTEDYFTLEEAILVEIK